MAAVAPRVGGPSMSRRYLIIAGCIGAAVTAAAFYSARHGGGPKAAAANAASPIASIRFRTALSQSSDGWRHIYLEDNQAPAAIRANAVLWEGEQLFRFSATMYGDEDVVVDIGPLGPGPVATVVFHGTGGGREVQQPNAIPHRLFGRAAEFVDILRRTCSPGGQ
jgi:hypothetical protein